MCFLMTCQIKIMIKGICHNTISWKQCTAYINAECEPIVSIEVVMYGALFFSQDGVFRGVRTRTLNRKFPSRPSRWLYSVSTSIKLLYSVIWYVILVLSCSAGRCETFCRLHVWQTLRSVGSDGPRLASTWRWRWWGSRSQFIVSSDCDCGKNKLICHIGMRNSTNWSMLT